LATCGASTAASGSTFGILGDQHLPTPGECGGLRGDGGTVRGEDQHVDRAAPIFDAQ